MSNFLVAAAYDQLAERWLDENFDPGNGVAQHLRALAFLSGAEGGRALNVGCGCNTRFNALLRGHGLQLEGIDVSEHMVALAAAARRLFRVRISFALGRALELCDERRLGDRVRPLLAGSRQV